MYRKFCLPSDLSVSNVRGGFGGGLPFARLCSCFALIEPADVALLAISCSFEDLSEPGESEWSVFARGRGCMSMTLSVLC